MRPKRFGRQERKFVNVSPHPSLVTKFAVLSAVAFVVLGVVLTRNVRSTVTQEHLKSATHSADLVASLGIKPLFSPSDFSAGLSRQEVDRIDGRLSADKLRDQVVRIKVWSRDGTVIYSDADKLIGAPFDVGSDLKKAFEGHVGSEVSSLSGAAQLSERRFGRLLEVYVPIKFEDVRQPVGAFEMYLPYAPIEAGIVADVRALQLKLLIGLAVLYLVLFRIVSRASRSLRAQALALRRHADENEFHALHDSLTTLPNRRFFHDRVQQAVLSAQRSGSSMAVMMLDLNRFKEVNDTLGHHNGDVLLRQIADRLKSALREYDSVARLGGDEFAVLIPEMVDRAGLLEIASRVQHALRTPFVVQDLSLEVSASSGVAIFPEHGSDADQLLQRADVAMYVAKANDDPVAIYDAAFDNNSPSRLVLVGELRQAIQNSDLLLHYQPKIDLSTGEIAGVEALVRWRHPDRGIIPPDDFVELAEKTGLIKPLTHWVIDTALGQTKAWRSEGIEIDVAVNLSVRNLMDVSLPNDVTELLAKWSVSPEQLTFEITESAMMVDPSRTLDVLTKLHQMGITLSIDDFGTGHSSLAYLKQLPVSEIKIDKSFVRDMSSESSGSAIVRSTIDLGHNLAMRVVAEGVESDHTLDELESLGCDVIQGFFFSRPLPGNGIPEWIAQHQWQPEALAATA